MKAQDQMEQRRNDKIIETNTGQKIYCSNYKRITLNDIIYKILVTFLKRKIERIAEELIGDYQRVSEKEGLLHTTFLL